jgi:hypothetical protein
VTRVLFAGDTHGQTAHVDHLLRVAVREGCPWVFVAGDFGYWEHQHDGRLFLDKVDRRARQHGVRCAFLDGNHDNVALLRRTYQDRDDDGLIVVRDHVRYAPRGHRWTWGSSRLLAAGGAASLDKDRRLAAEQQKTDRAALRALAHRDIGESRDYAGTLWFPDEELTDDETDRIIAAGGRVDLLLTHDKPRDSVPSFNRKTAEVAYPNQDRIQRIVDALRPTRPLHGHLHHRYTQTLANGTVVDGLACDPAAGHGEPGYRVQDSWLVVDL